MKNKKYAFLINFGIEYRNFLLSGLIRELSSRHDVVILRKDINNIYLDEYTNIDNINQIKIPTNKLHKNRGFFEKIFQSIRQSSLKVKNFGNFRNYNENSNKITIKDYIKSNFLIYNIFKIFTRIEILFNYYDKEIIEILKDNEITDLVVSGYASQGSIKLLRNSSYLSINNWVLINSWKDFYINDFIPFKCSGIFVWSNEMKNNYLKTNKHLNKNIFFPFGNIVFDKFFDFKPFYDLEFYSNKYKFEISNKLFLYTMLDPDRYENEVEIITLISNLLSKKLNINFTILVKKNPFDSSNNVDNYFHENPNVKVLEHFSIRDKKNDFFVQSRHGENEWGDLLYHSDLILGAASTVVLETLMMKKKFITIGFDKNGLPDNFMINIANAPFYKEILTNEDIYLCKNIEDFFDILNNLSNTNQSSKLPQIIGSFDGTSKMKIIKILEEK